MPHFSFTSSRILAIFAGFVLLLTLMSNRAERILLTTVPFWSLAFIALFGVAVLLAIIGIGGVSSRKLKQLPVWGFGAWVVVSFGALWFVSQQPFFTSNAQYITPFAFWAILIYVAIFLQYTQFSQKVMTGVNFLAKIALNLFVIFLFLEIVLRVWFTLFGTEIDRVNYVYDVRATLARYNRYAGEAYVNFGLSPTHPDHNASGYRSYTELETPKPEGTFRIFTLGGSTTYGISLPNTEAYPQVLQSLLHEAGYTHVEVVNAGVPQYATYENLVNFQFKILDDEPDMIITYEGINDVVTRLVDPEYYRGNNPMRGVWDTSHLYNTTPPSVLLRFLGINTGIIPRPTILDSVIASNSPVQRCSHPTFCENIGLSPLEVLSQNPPIFFERNLRHLITLAEANNVAVVLSTWAYYPKPASDGSLYMTYPHMQQGSDEHNAITRRLAQTYNLPLIDFASTVPDDATLWLDGLHLTAKGARIQAEQYAQFLIENGLIPKP